MAFLNTIFRSLFDLLLLPFEQMAAWIPLTLLGFVLAVLALLTYKGFSDQDALERVKAKIAAGFYEIRLFNDNFGAIMRALGGLLKNNGLYVALSLVPLFVMLVPMVFVFAQLQFHYGYHGLEPGEPTTVTLTFDESVDSTAPPQIELAAPEGVRVESPAVWIPKLRQYAWRVVGEQEGRHQLRWTLAEGQVDKSLTVTDDYERISPVRYAKGFLNQLLYPAEPPIDGNLPVESITVAYEPMAVPFLGMEWPWWLVFFVTSIVFAFMIRERMGVTF